MNDLDSSAARRQRLATSMAFSAMASAAGTFAMLRPSKDGGPAKAARQAPALAPVPSAARRQQP